MTYLKYITDSELLEELHKRIDEKKSIDWGITYSYNSDMMEMRLTCKDNSEGKLTFYRPAGIEKCYTLRQFYKILEPNLTRNEQKTSKSELDKVFELMKERQKKN